MMKERKKLVFRAIGDGSGTLRTVPNRSIKNPPSHIVLSGLSQFLIC